MCRKLVEEGEKRQIAFSQPNFVEMNIKNTNKVRTARYSLLTWVPKSLFMQFRRAANIYFLIISILTSMPFSPKNPVSMIGTFAGVLIFTMLKELYEDIARHKQDRTVNNRIAQVYDVDSTGKGVWIDTKWKELKAGQMVKITKNSECPADILLLQSSDEKGVVYVDTMNLDGETNLKEKSAPKETHDVREDKIPMLSGTLTCDTPNEFLDKWDGNIQCTQINRLFNCNLKNLLLRGCFIKNIDFCVGIVVYTGPETKIMMNSKKPPTKVSNVMKMMNKMLYTVFAFQLTLLFIFSSLSVVWNGNYASDHIYLDLDSSGGFGQFIIQMLTYWVAYSHLIPISLYVVLEMIKLTQSIFINNDMFIYHSETGYSKCRNSDLIEELGQVEFIFSDKTGTLTCNVMEYKECSIGGKIYESVDAFKTSMTKGPAEEKALLHQFIECLAVCHSVQVDDNKETGVKSYQASSPDELALVEGARD